MSAYKETLIAAGVAMLKGDSKEEHQKKLERKRRELERRGWSQKRIEAHMKHWCGFNYGKQS
jgi:hypothetical protein